MSPVNVDQVVELMAGITALVVALTALFVQMRALHGMVNSRMTELLELTRESGHAAGLRSRGTIDEAGVAPDAKEAP